MELSMLYRVIDDVRAELAQMLAGLKSAEARKAEAERMRVEFVNSIHALHSMWHGARSRIITSGGMDPGSPPC